MTARNGSAMAFAALLCTVFTLLGLCAAYSIEAEDAMTESLVLREELREIEAHDEDLRAKLVALSDDYHALYDACAPEINEEAWQEIGECTVTHYCGCSVCCGHTGCITATGTLATMGRTVGVDPKVIPLGSEVLLNGVIYIAEDTGVRGKAVDIYIESHEQAEQMGTYSTLVCWRETTEAPPVADEAREFRGSGTIGATEQGAGIVMPRRWQNAELSEQFE